VDAIAGIQVVVDEVATLGYRASAHILVRRRSLLSLANSAQVRISNI
jgi:hypothetical protein